MIPWLARHRLLTLRHVLGAPLRSSLTVGGVALGVAMLVATASTNEAVLASFAELGERAGGKADLELSGDESGLDEALVDRIAARADLAAHVAGRVEQSALLVDHVDAVHAVDAVDAVDDRGAAVRVLVLGIDLLGDLSLFPFAAPEGDFAFDDALAFMNDPHALLVGETLARERGLRVGSTVGLRTARGVERFSVAAVLRETGSARALGGQVVVMFVDAAGLAFDRPGRVDRIAVALAPARTVEEGQRLLAELAGPGVIVERPSGRAAQLGRMTASFRSGLQITAMVAVLIGMFLVYNAVSVAVGMRRREIGVLRALGLSRGGVAGLILVEATLLGVVGGALGVGLGAALARAVVGQFGQNVSRFFENIAAPLPALSPALALHGMAAGLAATLAAALVPALRAARLVPVEAMRRAVTAPAAMLGVIPRGAAGLLAVAVACGGAGLLAPRLGLAHGGLAALLLFFVAAAAATPAWLVVASPIAARGVQRVLGVAARLGVANVPRELGRGALTTAALALAVALGFTLAAYTHSYESSCLAWADQAIPADLVVAAGSPLLDRNTIPFAPSWAESVAATHGVAAVNRVRSLSVPFRGLRLEVLSLETATWLRRLAHLPIVDGPGHLDPDALTVEPVALVSENLAWKTGLRPGDSFELPSPTGIHRVRVAAVVVDYSSDQGMITIDRRWALAWWGDERVEALHVYLAAGVDPALAAARIRERLGAGPGLFVVTAAAFKAEIRRVIHQTFGIAGASEAVALLVALLGVLGAMLSSVIDRRRELGLLRAVGASRAQVVTMVVAEAAWIGVSAVVLAGVAAVPAARVFVEIIGVEASGWRVPFQFPVGEVVCTGAVVIGVAAAAALGPAWRAARRSIADGADGLTGD